MDTPLRELVEQTLCGKDARLVARCDVPGILTALDTFGIFDLDALAVNLDTSLTALQLALGGTAPPSFLALLKAELARRTAPAPTPVRTSAPSPMFGAPSPMFGAPSPMFGAPSPMFESPFRRASPPCSGWCSSRPPSARRAPRSRARRGRSRGASW